MATQKIRVRTDALLAALFAYIENAEKEYKCRAEEYDAAIGGWCSEAADALYAYAEDIHTGLENGTLVIPTIGGHGSGAHLDIPFEGVSRKPQKPSLPSLHAIKQQIALLRLSAEETMLVSTDSSLMYYLGEWEGMAKA